VLVWLQSVAAVVLRVDSPGGDALASDLMWRAILQTRKQKPVIASMGDVAASGGASLSLIASQPSAQDVPVSDAGGVWRAVAAALLQSGIRLSLYAPQPTGIGT